MYYYKIARLILQSNRRIHSFGVFECEPAEPTVTLTSTDEQPPAGPEIVSRMIVHRVIPNGWCFHPKRSDEHGLYISSDYTRLKTYGESGEVIREEAEWFIRIATECMLARMGYVSLHAAAIETQGGAYAFSGPSGIGKSTRAAAWQKALGAELVNGDRPLIDVNSLELYGVPWDGKEMCLRNVHYPLRAICEVRRSNSVYIREMSFTQRRKLLMRQCFLPMWDNETAAIQMANITRLAASAHMVRIFSGPDEEDARALYDALEKHHYLKEEPDMKAKPGFVLRNVVDEFILMPTGDNIGKFNGTILLNEVSALVWEKLQNPVSKDDLLKAILDEFEVEKAVASADLDALLKTLSGYGVIEED